MRIKTGLTDSDKRILSAVLSVKLVKSFFRIGNFERKMFRPNSSKLWWKFSPNYSLKLKWIFWRASVDVQSKLRKWLNKNRKWRKKLNSQTTLSQLNNTVVVHSYFALCNTDNFYNPNNTSFSYRHNKIT